MLIYSSNQKNLVEALKKDHWHNDLIQKYLDYTQSKQRVIKTGRTAWNDSGKSKTYKAEWKFQAKFKYDIVDFDNAKEAQKYMKRILKSKLWAELCGGDAKIPDLEVVGFRGRTAGRAYGYKIQLCAMNGMDAYTLLHEMAHCAGHMHHDVSFRQCILRLTSRFIGVEAAKFLKKCFKEQGLKMSVRQGLKSPEEWLVGYQRLAAAREKIAA
jgi:hypothetical protein